MIILAIVICICTIGLTIWSNFITQANNLLFILVKQPNEYRVALQIGFVESEVHPLHTFYEFYWGENKVEIFQIKLSKPRNISIYKSGKYLCEYKDIPSYYRAKIYYKYLQQASPMKARLYSWIMKMKLNKKGISYYRTNARFYLQNFLNELVDENMSVTDIREETRNGKNNGI